ncbi:SMC3_protein [Hexamita inflata]|uniref:SMC3 protein n=1 Tax=Hexamita inflata TaxID=28002 RepID=A0AA86UTP6_9EUKA|nr:SMC3 protein [Hexamita inflata]
MLSQVNLSNFKQFGQAEAQFTPGLNAIIGRNGEGKSNLLHAIRLVSNCSDSIENCIQTTENVNRAEIHAKLNDQTISRIITEHSSQFVQNNKQIAQNKVEYPVLIIEQSKTDQLAKMSKQQLFEEFQHTVGIKNYETKRQNVAQQLEATKKKRVEAEELLEDYENKVLQVKEQAEEYEQFLQIQNSIKEIETKIKTIEMEEIQQILDQEENEKTQLQQAYEEVGTHIQVTIEQHKNINTQIEEAQQNLSESTLKVEQIRAHIQKLIDINYQEEQQEEQKELNIDTLNQQLSEVEQELTNKVYELENLKIKQTNIQKQRTQDEIMNEIADKQQQLQEQTQQVDQLHPEAMDIQIKEHTEQIKALLTQLQQPDSSIYSIKQNLNNLIFKRERFERKSQENIFQQNKSLNELFQQYPQKFTAPIKYLQQMPGYKGLFGEMITVDESLYTVIQNAAGGLLFNVIVETTDAALKMVEQLKQLSIQHDELKGAKVNMIIMEEFQGKQALSFQSQIQSQESAMPLSQVIKYDDCMQGIIDSYLGRVLLVRSFSLANELSQQFSCDCYTIEGDCVLQSGLVNAGYHSNTRVKMFQQYIQHKQEGITIQQQIKQLDTEQILLQEQLGQIQSDVLKVEQSNLKINSEVDYKQKQVNDLKLKRHEIESQKSEALSKQKTLSQQIRNLEQLTQSSQHEDPVLIGQQIRSFEKQIDELLVEQSQLNMQIKSFYKRRVDEQVYEHAQFKRVTLQLFGFDQQIQQQLRVLLQNSESILFSYQQSLSALLQQEQQLKQQIAQYKQKLSDITSDLSEISSSIFVKQQLIIQIQKLILNQPTQASTQHSKTQLQTQLSVWNQKLKSFGPTNALVFDTFQLQKEKLEENTLKLTEIKKTEREVETCFTVLEQKHKTEVETNFLIVNNKFKQIFMFLTQKKGELQLKNKEINVKTDFGPHFQELSGGQLAVTSLALILAFNSTEQFGILLLDEPDSNLDMGARERLSQLLQQKCEQESSQIIFTSFKKEMVEKADNILMVRNGEIVVVEDIEEIEEGVWA